MTLHPSRRWPREVGEDAAVPRFILDINFASDQRAWQVVQRAIGMTSACPCVNISYGTWRLRLLQRLCTGTQPSGPPALPFLHPRAISSIRNDRRDFHNSARRERGRLKDVKRSVKFRASRSEKHVPDQMSNEKSDEVSMPKNERGSRNSPTQKEAGDGWNPYSDSSLAEMQQLVDKLQVMADQARNNQIKGQVVEDKDNVLFEHGSMIWSRKTPHLPESPLERRLPWDREKKEQVRSTEVDRNLENNVWAQMLASPTRLDRGTKARLPKDLMVSWGVMQNPSDGGDYLLPIELSDLEGLQTKLEVAARPTEQTMTVDERGVGRKVEAERSQASPRVVLAPNQLLLDSMTEEFMQERLSRGKNKTPISVTNSPKLNANLIPFRWRYKQDEFEAFRRTRQKFNEKLGREPDADEPDTTNKAKLDKLQWQPDISTRINKIMGLRVMTALDAVGRDNTSKRAVHDRRVQGLIIPKEARLYVNEGWTLSEDKPSRIAHDRNGVLREDQGMAPAWLHGAILLYIGDPKSYRRTIQQWHRSEETLFSTGNAKLNHLQPINLLPPMITINDQFRLPVFNLETLSGHEHSSEIEKVLQANKILTLDFWTQHAQQARKDSTSAPPNLAVDANIPSSPLDAGEQVLSSILTSTPRPTRITDAAATTSTPYTPTSIPTPTRAASINSSTGPDKEGKQTSPYLLLIKPSAKHASVLARELWQYWRYIGGRGGWRSGSELEE